MKANAEQGLLGRKEFCEASSWGWAFVPRSIGEGWQAEQASRGERGGDWGGGGWDFQLAGTPCPAFHVWKEGEPGCLS